MSIDLGTVKVKVSTLPELSESDRAIVNAAIALAEQHPAAALPGRNLLNLVAKLNAIAEFYKANSRFTGVEE